MASGRTTVRAMRIARWAMVTIALGSCGGDSDPDTGVTDTGSDTAIDTGSDTSVDTGADTSVDTGADTTVGDTGSDVLTDTGTDTAADVFSCTPDVALRCAGDANIERCNSAGDGVVTVVCASGCNTARLECNECVPSEDFCVDEMTIGTCEADGTLPSTDTSCIYGCNGSRSQCNACVPNTTQCHRSASVTCDADGDITTSTECAIGCVAGMCVEVDAGV